MIRYWVPFSLLPYSKEIMLGSHVLCHFAFLKFFFFCWLMITVPLAKAETFACNSYKPGKAKFLFAYTDGKMLYPT